MDPYYRRQRRRRLLWRSFVIAVFFGILSLPLLYLLRGEVRRVAAFGYHMAQRVVADLRAAPAPPSAPGSSPAPERAEAAAKPPLPEMAQAQAQAQPTPSRPAPSEPAPRNASLGTLQFRVPPGYIRSDDDLRQKNQLVLHALLPELVPRARGREKCAPKQVHCPDFAVVRLTSGAPSIDSQISKRYRRAGPQLGLMPADHDLRQVPPRRSGELGGRHFLAETGGRTTWIRCRDLSGPDLSGPPPPKRRTVRVKGRLRTIEPRQPPAATTQPAKPAKSRDEALAGYCTMSYEMPDGVNVTIRFASANLGNWASIQAKSAQLITRLRG